MLFSSVLLKREVCYDLVTNPNIQEYLYLKPCMWERNIKLLRKKTEGRNIQERQSQKYCFQGHFNTELELNVKTIREKATNYDKGKQKEQWHFLFSYMLAFCAPIGKESFVHSFNVNFTTVHLLDQWLYLMLAHYLHLNLTWR